MECGEDEGRRNQVFHATLSSPIIGQFVYICVKLLSRVC